MTDERTRPAQYRIGAIGAGRMGMHHVRAVAATPAWDLAYVCDLSDERLAVAEPAAPGAQLIQDHRRMLDDPTLDAVTINTLSDARPALITQALEAGKHVLCEKPLAPTAEQARNVLKAIKTTDRCVSVNLFYRHGWHLRRAHDLVKLGAIGDLAVIRLNHCTWGRPVSERESNTHYAVEGHVLHDCGMHLIDVLRWFGESNPRDEQTVVQATRFWQQPYDLYFMAMGRLANDIAFDLHNAQCYSTLAASPANHSRYEFIGTTGVIRIEHDFETVKLTLRGPNDTLDEQQPYLGKAFDVYYREFAQWVHAHKIQRPFQSALARPEDAAEASRIGLTWVDKALGQEVPNIGEPWESLAGS